MRPSSVEILDTGPSSDRWALVNPDRRPTHSNPDHRSSAPEDRYELERFKRDIDLTAFAASKGYRIDPRESSASSRVLRHDGSGDKLIVGKAADGHWQYFSVRDRDDNGTIVDFVQRRERKSLGEIRRELRQWTHTPQPEAPAATRPVQPVIRDRNAVAAELTRSRLLESHPYLESRGLVRATLGSPRFRGTWRMDSSRHGNVIFPHHDERGLSGFEVKNHGFTGFAKGGDKGIWSSKVSPGDQRLVIAESAIDALSYHQVNPHPKTRYISFAGALNAHQPGLIESSISWMPAGSTVVAATDKDAAGEAFAKSISELCAKHSHVTYERHAPRLGKDWNDHLSALRDCEPKQPQPAHSPAAVELGRRARHDWESGTPAETLEFLRHGHATFERTFGTTRESEQSDIRAHRERDGFTPDRSGRGGPDR